MECELLIKTFLCELHNYQYKFLSFHCPEMVIDIYVMVGFYLTINLSLKKSVLDLFCFILYKEQQNATF